MFLKIIFLQILQRFPYRLKLKKDKRDQVMRLIFGDNDIEILNK